MEVRTRSAFNSLNAVFIRRNIAGVETVSILVSEPLRFYRTYV